MSDATDGREGRGAVQLVLTPIEARVLGVLVEKERTVPDTYPLSLNALTGGCNQKNNRDPVMEVRDAEVQAALDGLQRRSLAIESSGSRVMRYAHNLGRVLKVPSQAEALLATLMLRGAQTAGELRIGAERLHKFADISSVEAFLEELAARPVTQGGALVVKLPRRIGEREQRWAHLLAGPIDLADFADPADGADGAAGAVRSAAIGNDDLIALRAQVADLRREVDALKAAVAALQERA